MQDFNTMPDAGMSDPNARPPVETPKRRRRVVVVAAIVVALVVGGGGFVAMIGGIMKSSFAYENAMARAAADCRVAELIGAPIEAGTFVSGSVETTGPSGHAELAIPVEGSSGAGTLHVVASRTADIWSFELLRLDVDGTDRRLDLLTPGTCTDGAAAAAAQPPAPGGAEEAPAGTKAGSIDGRQASPPPSAAPSKDPALGPPALTTTSTKQ